MQKIKEYLLITIGVALTAIALEYFFFPCDIAAGGVSGIGLVINKVFQALLRPLLRLKYHL